MYNAGSLTLKSYYCALYTDLKPVHHFINIFSQKIKLFYFNSNTIALNLARCGTSTCCGLQILQLAFSRRPRRPSTVATVSRKCGCFSDKRNITDARLITVKAKFTNTFRGSWSTTLNLQKQVKNDKIVTCLIIKYKNYEILTSQSCVSNYSKF